MTILKPLCKKVTQTVLNDIDKYIDYFARYQGQKPEVVTLTTRQYEILKNEAKTNKDFRHELSNGIYRNIKLKVSTYATETQTRRI